MGKSSPLKSGKLSLWCICGPSPLAWPWHPAALCRAMPCCDLLCSCQDGSGGSGNDSMDEADKNPSDGAPGRGYNVDPMPVASGSMSEDRHVERARQGFGGIVGYFVGSGGKLCTKIWVFWWFWGIFLVASRKAMQNHYLIT